MHLDQSESERWARALYVWSHPQPREEVEAEHYVIQPELVASLRQLLDRHPEELDSIPHVTIIGSDGRTLLCSYDHFHPIMEIDPEIEQRLKDPRPR